MKFSPIGSNSWAVRPLPLLVGRIWGYLQWELMVPRSCEEVYLETGNLGQEELEGLLV